MTVMSPTTTHRPLPEALSRDDHDTTGAWTVDDCAMARGVPVTNVVAKVMIAPQHDHPTARVVRAHEMTHAKVSPLDLKPWLERGIATEASLRACEEYRVNYLVKKSGFDTGVLMDGSERLATERMVAMDDWDGIVHLAMATANTGGYKEMMKALRKHKPVWGKVIDDVVKRANREARKVRDLASTSTNVYGVARGFEFTERIAEWCDRLCSVKPPEPKPEDSPKGSGEGDGGGAESEGEGEGESTPEAETPKRGRGRPRKDEASPTNDTDSPHKSITISSDGSVPPWFPLAVQKLPTPIAVTGAIGKKRVASNSGRHPRRLHRLMTDPHKRVFDRVIRGKGGVVVIDCSGSMHLDEQEVRQLTEVSHGATVLAYTVTSWTKDEDGVPVHPNAWILSERGRMANITDGLPFNGSANGVDLPALKWAVDNRHHPTAPIVWVCDGMVTGYGDRTHPLLTKVCYEFVKRHRIILVPDVEKALDTLRRLGRGEKVTPNYDSLKAYAESVIM